MQPGSRTLGAAARTRLSLRIAQALAIEPDYADAHYNLAGILKDQGQFQAAIAAYRAVIRLQPEMVEAHVNLGLALKEQGDVDEAIVAYREAIRLRPDLAEPHYHLGFALALQGRLDQAIPNYRKAIARDPTNAAYQSQLLQTYHYHPDFDAATIFQEHLRWSQEQAEPLNRFIQPHGNVREPERLLRIGYVSADFRNHACAFCLEPLLAAHDRSQFEIVCYAEVAQPDEVTQRIKAHAHAWRNTVGIPDEQLAAQIRDDRIDILVDLKVHTAENRLLVFAQASSRTGHLDGLPRNDWLEHRRLSLQRPLSRSAWNKRSILRRGDGPAARYVLVL